MVSDHKRGYVKPYHDGLSMTDRIHTAFVVVTVVAVDIDDFVDVGVVGVIDAIII